MGEAFHYYFEPSGGRLLNFRDAARQVAPGIPSLQSETRAAHFQVKIFSGEGQQLFTRFEQRRLAAILEESLDFRADFLCAAAGNPLGGRHGNRIIAHGMIAAACRSALARRLPKEKTLKA
jgi:hypothetical protein